MTRWPERPRLSPTCFKGHGLGNDYLVFREDRQGWLASPDNVRRVCDRHRGVGSDGLVAMLTRPDGSGDGRWPLRMFNPEGGEFERSGNGLRIFAACVASRGYHASALDATGARVSVRTDSLVAHVGGEDVRLTVHGRDGPLYDVSVEMGAASTGPAAVELATDAIAEHGEMVGPDGLPLRVVPVSVGNPHLVVLCDPDDPDSFSEGSLSVVGPYLTAHPALAHGANVQLARPSGERSCDALIWERGVGRTSASGTSSCAVAVAMVTSGLLPTGRVRVDMPGGTLTVDVDERLDIVLRGPVEEVFDAELRASLLATFEP